MCGVSPTSFTVSADRVDLGVQRYSDRNRPKHEADTEELDVHDLVELVDVGRAGVRHGQFQLDISVHLG